MSNKISPNVKSAQKQVIITTIYHKKFAYGCKKRIILRIKAKKKIFLSPIHKTIPYLCRHG